MSEEPNNNDLVVVEWHGRKIFIKKEKLDEWHGMKSEEQKVDYVNSHPEVRQGEPVSVHRMNRVRALQEDDDLVMVHWSGNKVLLLERAQLDEWYNASYEDHVDFVQKHPETQLVE